MRRSHRTAAGATLDRPGLAQGFVHDNRYGIGEVQAADRRLQNRNAKGMFRITSQNIL